MKTYGGAEVWLHFGTRWRWVVSFTSRPPCFLQIAPGSHWIAGWAGLRAGLEFV